jgi:hypothetical protein
VFLSRVHAPPNLDVVVDARDDFTESFGAAAAKAYLAVLDTGACEAIGGCDTVGWPNDGGSLGVGGDLTSCGGTIRGLRARRVFGFTVAPRS